MTKDAQKSYTIDQNEFDRRVDRGDDPFEVARALRPAQPGPKVQGKGILPALAGTALAVLAVALSAYLLWQMIGLQNRITGLDAKVGELSERVGRSFTPPTPASVVALTPDKIELRTSDLNVTVGGPEKDLLFVILSGTQAVGDHPVKAEVISGPGQVAPRSDNTKADGTFSLRYQPVATMSGDGKVTIRISAGTSVSEDFELSISQPPLSSIELIPDPQKQNPASVSWGSAFSVYFQLSGTTPTPAQDVSIECVVDQEQFVKIVSSDETRRSWSQLAQGEKAQVAISLKTTDKVPASNITANVTCVAQAKNGEGLVQRSVAVMIQAPMALLQESTIEIAVNPPSIPADGQSKAIVTVQLLTPDKSPIGGTIPITLAISPKTAGDFSPPPWKTVDGVTEVEFVAGTVPMQAEIKASVSETVFDVETINLISPADVPVTLVVLKGNYIHLWLDPSGQDILKIVVFQMTKGTTFEKLEQTEGNWQKVAMTMWLPSDAIRYKDEDSTWRISKVTNVPVLVEQNGVLQSSGQLSAGARDLKVKVVDQTSRTDLVAVQIEGWVENKVLDPIE